MNSKLKDENYLKLNDSFEKFIAIKFMQDPLKKGLKHSSKRVLKKMVQIDREHIDPYLPSMMHNLSERKFKSPSSFLKRKEPVGNESILFGRSYHRDILGSNVRSLDLIPQKFSSSPSVHDDQSTTKEKGFGSPRNFDISKVLSLKQQRSLDLKHCLDEIVMSESKQQEKLNVEKVKSIEKPQSNFKDRDIRHLKERNKAAEVVNKQGDNLYSKENQTKSQNDIFRLTLNENFPTNLRQYQPYLNYCSQKELDKQMLISDVKHHPIHQNGSHKLNKTRIHDIVSEELSPKNYKDSREEVLSIIAERKSLNQKDLTSDKRRSILRLNNIYNAPKPMPQTEMNLNRSKISSNHHHQSKIELSPEERLVEHEYKDKLTNLNSTFEEKFKKRDPFRKPNKHLDFLSALRWRKKIEQQVEHQKKHSTPRIMYSFQKELEKSRSDKIATLKMAAIFLKKQIESQSSRIEEVAKKYTFEFSNSLELDEM